MITHEEIRKVIENSPLTEKKLRHVTELLTGCAQIRSRFVTEDWKVCIHVHVNFGAPGQLSGVFDEVPTLEDLIFVVLMCGFCGLNADYDFDDCFPKVKRDVIAEIFTEILSKNPQIRSKVGDVIDRISKLFEKRGKNLEELNRKAKAKFVEDVTSDIKESFLKVRDFLKEEDVVRLWREAVIQKVHQS